MINKQNNMVKSKRSQEEMVGFILIIVLVSVIALVFIFISLRKPAEIKASQEISNFLYSSLMYTTKCQPSQERYYDFKDLIKACYNSERCLDEQNSCFVLNKTATELIEAGFGVGAEAKYKAYEFKIYTGNETEVDKSLLYLKEGNFTSSITGSEAFFVSRENFHLRLRLYY